MNYINQSVISEIDIELKRAKGKFPLDFHSTHEGYGVLKEEVDELWDVIKSDGPKNRLRSESIQVAAMAIRIIQELT